MERNLHPTCMMLTSTVNLLQTLCLSAGVHAEVMQNEATRTLCGLLRMLVESGTIDKSSKYWLVKFLFYARLIPSLNINTINILWLSELKCMSRNSVFLEVLNQVPPPIILR